DVAKFHPISIPLIHRSLVHQTRRPVFESAVNALFPEVCRFDNMGVRRDKRVGGHTNLPPVYGAVGSSLMRLPCYSTVFLPGIATDARRSPRVRVSSGVPLTPYRLTPYRRWAVYGDTMPHSHPWREPGILLRT